MTPTALAIRSTLRAGRPVRASFGINRVDSSATGIVYTPGKTIAVVVNLDTNPNQFWVTPDISDTSGAAAARCGMGAERPRRFPRASGRRTIPAAAPARAASYFKGPTTSETGLGFWTGRTKPVMVGQNYGGQPYRCYVRFWAECDARCADRIGRPWPDLPELERRWRRWRQSGA